MLERIVLASSNPGKLREFAALLAPLGAEVLTQGDLGIEGVEETGMSFVENALLKARHASLHSGLPALADDSGIVVDALRGAPGLYSARYAGPGADDAANNAKLIAALQAHAQPWVARYHACIVLLRHPLDPCPLIAEADWEGHIQATPAGTGGFGYDPHFFLPSLGKTAAQLGSDFKNSLSHRAQAMHALLQRWPSR